MTIVTGACALAIVTPIAWIVVDLIARGAPHVDFAFLLESPSRSGRSGGIAPIVVSTVLIMLVCMAVVSTIGLVAAVGLSEYLAQERRIGRFVRMSLDLLAGTPSIAFGLFGHAFFCKYLGLGVSILSGGLTLACMVLPLFVRVSDNALRAVPLDVRLALDALSISKWNAIIKVLIPTAAPGVLAAASLAMTRSLVETAALLFTSGYATRTPGSLLDPGRALSVHIFDLAMNVSGGDANAYASSLVLVAALVVLGTTPLLFHAGTTTRVTFA